MRAVRKTRRKILTLEEVDYIQKWHDTMFVSDIAKAIRRSEQTVTNYLRSKRLSVLTRKSRTDYRSEITDLTRSQLCICDFEGMTTQEISDMFVVYPGRVEHLLDEMKQSGEYDRHISVFAHYNEGAYLRAKERRSEDGI